MSIKLNDKVITILKANQPNKLSSKEIATKIAKRYKAQLKKKIKESKNVSNEKELIIQLTREISSRTPLIQKKCEYVKIIEGPPRHFYYNELSENQEIAELEKEKSKIPIPLEADLYPLLSEYLFVRHEVFSKRINEKKSKNSRGKNGNKWLHPDIVGFENLSKNWCKEVIECSKAHYDKNAQMWSFEIKRLLNSSNVREAYFQTISNSSWANQSYLVAAEISGLSTLKELQILSSAHGVGVILLNVSTPTESQILIPARENKKVDWDSCNRLATENPDFNTYIKEIRKFYQTGETVENFWDYFQTPLDD
ncbi:hypothetical protein [Bacteriovorax sp. DB6_IX]|uniref:hypothetical protein n=1 Tax=Bacteriovorax sp. DB6_IX TaxID=1353530 RepID=UPI00038A3CBA|nr:hypothetical protein [Bacteriovorax sp. DB6_IX]EQC44448.1 hypothetical protein M901_0297 [Bacteriovorax sp. DB6_IX]